MTGGPARVDERPHAPGAEPWWCESWDFDFALPDASLGGYVRLDALPNQRCCWYTAVVVGSGRDPVVTVDHEVPLPRLPSLELRSEGLWADHIVEEPLDHVSVGCEAFALRLEPDADPLAVPLLGERTPFGLDLGWETEAPPQPIAGGYAIPCRVVGEVLVADGRITVDTLGWRTHTWGPDASTVWMPPDGAAGTASNDARAGADADESGPRLRGRLDDGEWLFHTKRPAMRLRLDPVAAAPFLVPGDPPAKLSRTLCRLIPTSGDGQPGGVAWSDQGP